MPMLAPVQDFQISSDSAGSRGYGAILNTKWLTGAWSMEQRSLSMAYRVLFPIVVAAALWGSHLVSRRVDVLCDNESVVAVLKSGSSRDQHLMGLLRHSSLLAIRHSFMFTASSVHDLANPVADSLSRLQFQCFGRLAPQADLTPCVIPKSLLASLQTS